jgi:hypothetical protein
LTIFPKFLRSPCSFERLFHSHVPNKSDGCSKLSLLIWRYVQVRIYFAALWHICTWFMMLLSLKFVSQCSITRLWILHFPP